MADYTGSTQSLQSDVSQLRIDYNFPALDENAMLDDPIAVFALWFESAVSAKVLEPNAMCISSTSKEGIPSSRMVLLKGYGADGFKFFTNYESRKGRELAENPYAALCFWWAPLQRSVRVVGKVSKVSVEESILYFQSRPKQSQIGSAVSHQSTVIADRYVLDDARMRLIEKYGEDQNPPVDMPDFWGGYLVAPFEIEFWQGGRGRLHDRIQYLRQDDGTWSKARLSP